MDNFLGISVADAISQLKACEDEKAAAVNIGNFVCNHFVVEEREAIKGLKETDISSSFDVMIAKLLADIDIRKAKGENDGGFTQEDLIKISKAGNYVRYAAYELIKGLKATYDGDHTVDFNQIMIDAIDRKIAEDTVDPATEEEVEKLMNETEQIMDDIDPDNPFYNKEEGNENAGNGDNKSSGNESSGSDSVDDGSSENSDACVCFK